MKDSKIYLFLKSNLFFFLLLTAVVFCLYGKSINFDFTYFDDDLLVLDNIEFLSDIDNVPDLFKTSVYFSKDVQYYRPVLKLSFLLETSLFGFNKQIYHLTNIILFLLSLYLMYVFLKKLKLNETVLKFVLVLIAVHPILTSCVVWIPARNDTLLAIFIFLSFIFFVKYLENNSFKNLLLYILFWAMAIFTKETALIVLFLFPLFIWCFEYRLNKREIIKNVLLFATILLIYFCLRFFYVPGTGLLSNTISVSEYLRNLFFGLFMYLYQLITLDIHVIAYDYKFEFFGFLIVFVAIMFITISLYKKLVTKKQFVWCISILILFLLPTFLLKEYSVLNHRVVIPISAIVMMVALIMDKIICLKKIKYIFVFLFCLVFIFCFSYSFSFQNKYRDEINFKINAYIDAPDSSSTCYWMACLYIENGNYEKAKEFLQKTNCVYYSDLALIYYREGDMDKAEELYNKSVESGINKAQCYRNLSIIYLKRDKDINKAIEYARLAVREDQYDDEYKKYLLSLENEIKNVK